MVVKQLFQKLPPVTRRDAMIAALLSERGQPSFFAKFCEAKRERRRQTADDAPAPVWELNDKVSGYEFARSHGVPIPRVYGEYARATNIDWTAAPAELVLKLTTGASAQAVWPLVRQGEGYRDLLSGSPDALSPEELVARIETARDGHTTVLMEELLPTPSGFALEVPPDYKLLCFHGVVGMIAVVGRPQRSGKRIASRFLAPDGADLGDALVGILVDPALPTPDHLDELIDVGERLSASIMSPFVRVDMYDTSDGIVFGEITPQPGGNHVLREDVDLHLGELWERAQHRLEQRAISGDLRKPTFGPHERRIPIAPLRTAT